MRAASRFGALAAILLTASLAPAAAPAASSARLPGYLLIADRGNDRVLLVNQAKQVLWAYPGPNGGMSMPFRFDDDVFFGPGYKTIISNQEQQDTIQILTFPGGGSSGTTATLTSGAPNPAT